MDTVTSKHILRWLELAAAKLDEKKDWLTQLDSAIGDGDHGANMARGFSAIRGKLPELADKETSAIFKTVAMTLISTVGGASGPLYGTLFLQAAGATAGKAELSHADLHAAVDAGVKGVMQRGKAVVGEKTMIDALVPAVEALRPMGDDSLAKGMARAVEAAQKGADSTVPLVARKGRASYLGERSAGHLDPGAASSVILLETLAAAVQPAG